MPLILQLKQWDSICVLPHLEVVRGESSNPIPYALPPTVCPLSRHQPCPTCYSLILISHTPIPVNSALQRNSSVVLCMLQHVFLNAVNVHDLYQLLIYPCSVGCCVLVIGIHGYVPIQRVKRIMKTSGETGSLQPHTNLIPLSLENSSFLPLSNWIPRICEQGRSRSWWGNLQRQLSQVCRNS